MVKIQTVQKDVKWKEEPLQAPSLTPLAYSSVTIPCVSFQNFSMHVIVCMYIHAYIHAYTGTYLYIHAFSGNTNWDMLKAILSFYFHAHLGLLSMSAHVVCWFTLRPHGWNVTLGKPWDFDEFSVEGTTDHQFWMYKLNFHSLSSGFFCFFFILGT